MKTTKLELKAKQIWSSKNYLRHHLSLARDVSNVNKKLRSWESEGGDEVNITRKNITEIF